MAKPKKPAKKIKAAAKPKAKAAAKPVAKKTAPLVKAKAVAAAPAAAGNLNDMMKRGALRRLMAR